MIPHRPVSWILWLVRYTWPLAVSVLWISDTLAQPEPRSGQASSTKTPGKTSGVSATPAKPASRSVSSSGAPKKQDLSMSGPSISGPYAWFQEANQLYNQGQYREAAQLFQRLVQHSSWANFAVFYNLGNCYVRLQEYGRALAYYRKAQRLRPNHLDLLHNIQLIHRKLGKTESTRDELRLRFLFWYYLLSLEQIFYAVVGFTGLCLLLWSVYLRRSVRGLTGLRWPNAALTTLTLILGLSFGIKLYQERYISKGVITQNPVTARSGYGDQFEPLFRLTEADQVRILESLEISTPSGPQHWLRVEVWVLEKDNKTHVLKTGWVPASAVQTI